MDVPFGFFSLLGALALIGIVVNNAILLIDFADQRVAEGIAPAKAMQEAVIRRIRPIGLTTLTTVAGLFPLAVTDATLWPPFAYTVIFGPLGSSLFCLLVVPALYQLIFAEKRNHNLSFAKEPKQTVAHVGKALTLLFILFWSPSAESQTLCHSMMPFQKLLSTAA